MRVNALKSINTAVPVRRLARRDARDTRDGMDRIIIRGGNRLSGRLPISGAKNAALTLLPCALLTDAPLTLTNLPRLADVDGFGHLLNQLGASTKVSGPPRTPTPMLVDCWMPLRKLTTLVTCIGRPAAPSVTDVARSPARTWSGGADRGRSGTTMPEPVSRAPQPPSPLPSGQDVPLTFSERA